jgi:hypothetical protein
LKARRKRKLHYTVSEFWGGNPKGKKGIHIHLMCGKEKKMPTKNTILGKTVIRNKDNTKIFSLVLTRESSLTLDLLY